MKCLYQFMSFEWGRFADGKVFQVVDVRPWSDYNTGEHLGTKVTAVIVADTTNYRTKDGVETTNLYEKIAFKVTGDVNNVAVGDCVVPTDVTAKVYGQYNNQLAVTCSGLSVVSKDA